ncbi:hypothetical protein HDU99_002904, partial [Rhizoclosmatium hyalinum]
LGDVLWSAVPGVHYSGGGGWSSVYTSVNEEQCQDYCAATLTSDNRCVGASYWYTSQMCILKDQAGYDTASTVTIDYNWILYVPQNIQAFFYGIALTTSDGIQGSFTTKEACAAWIVGNTYGDHFARFEISTSFCRMQPDTVNGVPNQVVTFA